MKITKEQYEEAHSLCEDFTMRLNKITGRKGNENDAHSLWLTITEQMGIDVDGW